MQSKIIGGRRWRRLAIVGVMLAGLGPANAVFTTNADASTGNQVVVRTIPNMRGCSIQLLGTWDGNGNDYAAARATSVTPPNFNLSEDVTGCEFELRRVHNGTDTQVSATHDVYSGTQTTYNYWDGAGYLCYVAARQIYGDTQGFAGYGPWMSTGTW